MCTLNRLTITNNTGHNKNLIKKDGLLIYRHTDTIDKETAKCDLIANIMKIFFFRKSKIDTLPSMSLRSWCPLPPLKKKNCVHVFQYSF